MHSIVKFDLRQQQEGNPMQVVIKKGFMPSFSNSILTRLSRVLPLLLMLACFISWAGAQNLLQSWVGKQLCRWRQ